MSAIYQSHVVGIDGASARMRVDRDEVLRGKVDATSIVFNGSNRNTVERLRRGTILHIEYLVAGRWYFDVFSLSEFASGIETPVSHCPAMVPGLAAGDATPSSKRRARGPT